MDCERSRGGRDHREHRELVGRQQQQKQKHKEKRHHAEMISDSDDDIEEIQAVPKAKRRRGEDVASESPPKRVPAKRAPPAPVPPAAASDSDEDDDEEIKPFSSKDLALMKKIKIVAQLDRVPSPLPAMNDSVINLPQAAEVLKESKTGSLSDRFSKYRR